LGENDSKSPDEKQTERCLVVLSHPFVMTTELGLRRPDARAV